MIFVIMLFAWLVMILMGSAHHLWPSIHAVSYGTVLFWYVLLTILAYVHTAGRKQ